MKLSIDYLSQRHSYWKTRIAEKGIWAVSEFLPVTFVIRKNHKRFNALFQRKIKIIGNRREVSDKIVFYNKVEDFDPKFIDNVLVHEMIHQYTLQNNIKDTSPHGKIFKGFMRKLNFEFKGELEIKVRDINPNLPLKGAGETIHNLLMLNFSDGTFLCAVVNPRKLEEFERLVRKNKKRWGITTHSWGESNDVYFNRFSRCTSRLHGIRQPVSQQKEFQEYYNIRTVKGPDISKKYFKWLR